MANYATLKAAIESTIRTNGQEEITGQILQNAIIALIESLGAEFQFAGVASTSTNPGTPDHNVMYIAGAGTYPNFGGTEVEKGHIGVFAYNGSWNNVVVETGAYFEFQEYPSGDAIEFTFYDSENTDGKTIKINKTVSGISNAPDEAISQWWAAQIQRKIQDVQGFTDNFTSLSTTEQSLGLFGIIKTGKVIDSITGVNKLIFIDDESNEYTVNTTDLPYVAPADFVSVKLQSGTASNVSINVRGDNDVLISHININEIANHPTAYTSAALALNDVPTLYRRKGMKVVYYDDTLSLWVEMLNVDDAGANWWTDVTNNWVIEGPIETELPTNTGGQQLRVGGTKRGNLDDVLNVNVWNNQATEYSSKDNARAAVPANKRKLGAIITYLVSTGTDTSGWMIDEFTGSSISDWAEADNWETIGPVSVSQNIETGHTDINIGSNSHPVASVEEVSQLGQKVDNIYTNKIVPDIYTFPSSAGYLSFSPITISQDGDSIEIDLLTSLTADDAIKGMAFCSNGVYRAICLTRNTISIKDNTDVWLDGMDGGHGQYNFTTGNSESLVTRGKVKIALEQGNLNVYVNITLCKSISNFSGTIQVDSIGKPYSGTNYWSGTIYSFKYTHNGVTKELYDLPGYSESNKGAISYTTKRVTSGVLQDTIEALEETKDDIDGIEEKAFKDTIRKREYPVSLIPERTKLSNYVSFPDTSAEVFTPNSEYDSYFFYADTAFECWLIDPGLSYLAISIGTSAGEYNESTHQIPCSSTTRYRKSNNNLPTESSPLSVSPGDVVVIDVPAGKSVSFVKKYNGVEFNGDTPLSDKHIKQVITASKPYYNYVEGLLEIMIPSNDGFVKYAFVHSVNVSRNCDVWRVDYAAKCDSSGLETERITTDGEWEIAIHLKDRTDFSGGIAHGDEIYSSILFFADGQVIDITNPASGSFSELRILETSTLYDPNDSVTPIATHTSEHIFNLNGLVINQALEWLVNAQLTESFMAMFPVAQAVTDTYCSDNNFSPVSLPAGGANQINIYGANQVNIWSNDANVFCVFGVGQYNGLQGSQLHFLMHNNGTTAYNKCYFFVSKNGDTVTAGDLWKTQTMYKIMAKNDN